MDGPIYLDYNATTPLAPEVLEAMLPYLGERFGNPSSDHPYGREARAAVEEARSRVARLMGCAPGEVLFTSGGTEANNLAIRGVCRASRGEKRHLVTTAVEHPAVLRPAEALEREGWRVIRVGVGPDGRVDPEDVLASLDEETALVSVMQANNETGALQPVAAIARLARQRGVPVHTDAAQSVGKMPVDVGDLGVDLLTIAGHKFYGPKGVGALFVRRGTPLEPLILGGEHEGGLRSGTENVPSIVGLGAAADLASRELPGRAERLRALRDRLHRGLASRLPGLQLNGPAEERLPNTLNVSIPDVDAVALLRVLDGVAAASGAACHSGRTEPSGVLLAMGLSSRRARCALRLTVGRPTTEEEVDLAVRRIAAAAVQLRDEKARES